MGLEVTLQRILGLAYVDSQLFDSSIFKKLVLNDLKRDLPKLEGDRGLRYWKDFYSASNTLSCLFASYS